MSMYLLVLVVLLLKIGDSASIDRSENDCSGNDISTTLVPPAEPPFRTESIPLRDGVRVVVDYFLPSSSGRYPTIVEVTPYGRGIDKPNFRNEAAYWIEHGYAFVLGDVRGTGDSQGDFIFFRQEGPDCADVIDWIAKQSWSNGRIAMRGASYTGDNQWSAAREQPKNLSCITPSASPARPMNEVPYDHGVFSLYWALNWIGNSLNVPPQPVTGPTHPNPSTWLNYRPLRTLDQYVLGRQLPLYQTLLDHPTYDDFWRSIDFLPDDYRKIQIPTLSFTGWFDSTLKGTIERFQYVQKYSSRPNDHFLIIGPYMHSNAADGGYDYLTGEPINMIGDFVVPENGFLPGREMTRSFYDWCLNDREKLDYSPIKMFITGSNRWMSRRRFPPDESQERSLYLTSSGYANGIDGDGKLVWNFSSLNREIIDQYEYRPWEPVVINMTEKPYDLPVDLQSLLDRQDILVYTTEMFEEPLTIIGNLSLELYFSSTVKDSDIIVEFMDVMHDGRSIKLGSRVSSQIRLRYRDGFHEEKMMETGNIYPIRIDLGTLGHTFLPGHRIRIAIMSSLFPWFNVNLNTGSAIDSDMNEGIRAHHKIYHSSLQHPSRLRLMVVDRPQFD